MSDDALTRAQLEQTLVAADVVEQAAPEHGSAEQPAGSVVDEAAKEEGNDPVLSARFPLTEAQAASTAVGLALPTAQSSSSPSVPEVLLQVSISDPSSPDSPPILLPVLLSRPYLQQRRPFLGGYRHHLSGRVKLHAEAQTERRKARGAEAEKKERETQTSAVVTRGVQTGREVGTQMDKKGEWLTLDSAEERVLVARASVPSEVLEVARESSACRLQCWLRVCFARRRMLQLRAAEELQQRDAQEHAHDAEARSAEDQQRQIHRRMHPRSKEDFELLYQELQAWRQHESSRIHSLAGSDEERDQSLSVLLSKEVKLLQTIDRLRLVAARERKTERTKRQLDQMQSPLEWSTSDGDKVEVITPHTLRAQQLIELYHALCLPVCTAEPVKAGAVDWQGRVDVLLHAKYAAGEMGGPVSSELTQLIEREQEWMQRRQSSAGWKAEDALAGLRQRLASLFLSLVQNPQLNPAAALYVDSVDKEAKERLQQSVHKPLPDRERSSSGRAAASRKH